MRLHQHFELAPHHRYQLEVVFLFVVGLFLFFPYFAFLELYNLDVNNWQWLLFWPWMLFYSFYSLQTRNKIKAGERKNPLKRPILLWVLLGLVIIALQIQPTDLREAESLNISFIIFSIFLADSYWDFRRNANK